MTILHRIRTRVLATLTVAALAAFAFGTAGAATIVIVNNDGAGEGFNDPTPVAPVGGNPGVTLGAQRLFVFQHAASIWGSLLASNVTIEVRAQFDPQTCTATSAVLGSAGPIQVFRDFTGALVAGHWYHVALANALEGLDLSPGTPDINATFNSNLNGQVSCLNGTGWYLGIDGNEGTNIELLPVVLHELGHGLGFSTTTSGSTGNYLSSFPSIFDRFLTDNTSGLHWDQMTPAQRQANAISVDKLVWDGAKVFTEAPNFLSKRPRVLMNAPAAVAGQYYDGQAASYGAALTAGGLTGNIELVNDGAGASVTDGCEPLVGFTAGNIALIDRGTCAFTIKSANAQAAGASGVIIVNNVAAGLPGMGGTDPTITIPNIGISQANGNTIKANLVGANGTMGLHPTLLAGAAANGKVLMYAPNPFQGGSSVSHYDVTLTPNALMEPAINGDLHDAVDLTLPAFCDIGWNPLATPVALAMFTAEEHDRGILLNWMFSDANEISVITVQRAKSDAGPWEAITTELGRNGPLTTALDLTAERGIDYYYRLNVVDTNGNGRSFGLASARRAGTLAGGVALSAPSPNPTKLGSSVTFRIPQPEFVRLSVVDASGRTVRTLHSGMMSAGEYTQTWDGRADRGGRVTPGLYFVNLVTSEGRLSQRVAVLQ